MSLLKPLLLLSFLLTTTAQDMYLEKILAELEIATLELQDDCENVAIAHKSSLLTNNYTERNEVQKKRAKLLKTVSETLKPLEEDVPPEFLRNWTLLVNPGDALLPEKDWSTLVDYEVGTDELVHTAAVHCKNGTQGCVLVKKGYGEILRSSRNQSLLKKGWSAWQTLLARKKSEFPGVLKLLSDAAARNGKEDPKSYWEMLADKEDAYQLADELWNEIKPIYFKLQEFVKTRLFRFYNISTSDSEIPVYLLGSNFGDDWSAVAPIVLPHPQLHYLAEAYLNKTKIQNVYKVAEQLTQNLSLGSLGSDFWSNSLFNMSICENHVLSFCVEQHSELFTCDKTTWSSYLDAFEVAIDVALRNMDYLNLARSDLRYCVVDEAVKGLGSVLGVKNLRNKVWGRSLFEKHDSDLQNNDMTELLLIALRVLPKLPFYLAADKWRLQLLENGFSDMEKQWWNFRKEYQGVAGVFNNESDFLSDPFITSNKPYLSKFLGTILEFQFLDYYKPDWQTPNQTIAENIANDENFRTMLHERSVTDWPLLIVNNHGFYDLSATPLVDFFAPLLSYLESAPVEQVIVTTPKTTTTTKRVELHPKALNTATIQTVNKKVVEEDTEPPLPPKHEHVEENQEGPNPAMETIGMYVGLALLGAVVVLIVFVVVSKQMKRKRTNNRRFET